MQSNGRTVEHRSQGIPINPLPHLRLIVEEIIENLLKSEGQGRCCEIVSPSDARVAPIKSHQRDCPNLS